MRNNMLLSSSKFLIRVSKEQISRQGTRRVFAARLSTDETIRWFGNEYRTFVKLLSTTYPENLCNLGNRNSLLTIAIRWLWMLTFKQFGKKCSWPSLRQSSGIGLKRLRKTKNAQCKHGGSENYTIVNKCMVSKPYVVTEFLRNWVLLNNSGKWNMKIWRSSEILYCNSDNLW